MKKKSSLAFLLLLGASALMAQVKINMDISGTTVSVSLVDNNATQALLQHLAEGPVTIRTSRYGGFEQVGAFPWSLPTSNSQIITSPGDVILYNSNQLVIFYGSNSWSYTRLGRIDGLNSSQLVNLLNVASHTITLSQPQASGIHRTSENDNPSLDFSKPRYNLTGQSVNASFRGLVMQNGRKFMNQ